MTVFPRLRDCVEIVKSSHFCIIVDKEVGNSIPVFPQQAVLLSLCDGSISSHEVAEVHSQAFDSQLEDSLEIVNHLLEHGRVFLDLFDEPQNMPIKFAPEDFIYPFEVPEDVKRIPYDTPIEMILPLTHKCNMRCVYCFRASGDEFANELTIEEHLDLVQQAIDLGIVRCTVTGGEPTLSEAFWPVIELLVENKVYPYVATNGSRITSDDAKRLVSLGIKNIQISFDAIDETIFDLLVGEGGFQRQVIVAIRECVKAGLNVRLKATLTKHNANQVAKIILFAYENGCNFLSFDSFTEGLFGRGNSNLTLSIEDQYKVFETIDSYQDKFSGLYIEPFVVKEWKDYQDIVTCGGLISGFVVQPNGDVGICEMLYDPNFIVANIREEKLASIWGNPKYLEKATPSEEELDPICRDCEYLPRCGTGCFNLSLVENRGMFGIDPRCWKAKNNNDSNHLL